MTMLNPMSQSYFPTGHEDDIEATSQLVPNSARSSIQRSITEKFSLSPSPHAWGMALDMTTVDPDDHLHNPDPRSRKNDNGTIFTMRGLGNLGCLFVLIVGMITLFAVYPIIMTFNERKQTTNGGFNLGGINATGQIPDFAGNYGLIDRDTPKSAYTKKSQETGEEMVLVFSDEFNIDGRSFYPGDDPFWEATDFHYWGTNDLEWYDPTQPTTGNGSLLLKIERIDPEHNHNLDYRSGMVQTWNKFCFTGGLLEASVMLPGSPKVSGLWPAVWAMGNLGRAGYGGTLDGMWPFTYDSCDVGTLPNQTYPGTQTPAAAFSGGDGSRGGVLSYLPGQKLSACTCPGESHPGPMRSDGSYVGRSAPEIDVLEAIVDADGGKVSLSAQWAPYNAGYNWLNTTQNIKIHDTEHDTILNPYKGGVYQQTTSGLALTNQECYELSGRCFAEYAFEYKPGFDDGYITWINDAQRAWTIYSAGMGADELSEIGPRPIPQEPMYIIANLGFSNNFGELDIANLVFPATMAIDYIRVYQPKNAVNVGCDPVNFPTSKYIETYKHVYTNPNLTTWEQTGQEWPKNRLAAGNGGVC